MIKIILISLVLLSSCSSNIKKSNVDFSNEMDFDEFKVRLDEYAQTNSYPNINN